MKEYDLLVPSKGSHVHGVYMEEKGPSDPEVSCSPGLRSYRIVAGTEDHRLGTLYGVILSGDGAPGIVVDNDTIRVNAVVADARTFETLVLARIRGTFLVYTHTTLPRRLYPDTGGTIPVVFCPRTKRIGSSAGMLLDEDEYRARFLPDRIERLITREGLGSWIPGTLTGHEGISRLLSNHYLDLGTWTSVRFWPRPDEFSQTMTVEEAATIIAADLSGFIRNAAEEFRIGITLTAGFDSRLLLAGARDVADRVEFFTTAPREEGLDQILASKMARDLGLKHRLVPLLPATEEDGALWDHAVGHAVLEGNRSSGPTLRSLPYDVIFTGMFGEPGRSRLYRHDYDTINGKRLTSRFVLSRLGRPHHPDLVSEVARWLPDLDWLPTSAVLDLAHMELKGSGWAMAQHAAQNAFQLEMNPIAQRSIRRAFLSVPPDQKGTSALFQRAIAAMWPELTEYPVNKFGDYRDTLKMVRKLFEPRRVKRYVLSRFS